MNTKEHLIEQHVREYESRLKHIEELYERALAATEHLDEEHDAHEELRDYASERLQRQAEAIKTMPIKNWRKETVQSAGPMAIWDVLAQKLEDFLERHE